MTGHEGTEVTGSVQYCVVNKSPCGQASMTGVGNSVVGLGVATDTGWHWGGIGTIRTNVTALSGLQDGYQ